MKQKKSQKGQALVEMVLILPILLLLLVTLVELGFIFYDYLSLVAGGREVARWGARGDYFRPDWVVEDDSTFGIAERYPAIDAVAVTYIRIGREEGEAVLVEVTRAKVGPIEWAEVPEIDVDALIAGHQAILGLNPRANDMIAIFVDAYHDHDLMMDMFDLVGQLRTHIRCMFRVTYQRNKGVL